jgi:hypothetical protein
MKKTLFSAALLSLLALSPIAQAAPVDVVDFLYATKDPSRFIPVPLDASVYPLMAGQHIPAGTLTVFSTETGQLVVTYETSGDWMINETHLEIALNPRNFPQTRKGNPRPGRFDFGGVQTHGTTAIQYVFEYGPAAPPESTIYVAAHAVVSGSQGCETAWSAGTRFAGANWFTYSTYVRPVDCGTNPSHPSCPQ